MLKKMNSNKTILKEIITLKNKKKLKVLRFKHLKKLNQIFLQKIINFYKNNHFKNLLKNIQIF